jgi:hypothetical protein
MTKALVTARLRTPAKRDNPQPLFRPVLALASSFVALYLAIIVLHLIPFLLLQS